MENSLPEGWVISSPLEISEKIRGVSYDKTEVSLQPKVDFIPVIRANNIVDSKIEFSDLVYVFKDRVGNQQILKDGDVIIAMSSGSKSVVGKAAQINNDWFGSFGAFCGVLRPVKDINSRYFGYFFQSREYRSRISQLASGTNINNLKNEHFDEILFPVAPLPEQHRIVAKLDALMERVERNKQRLDKIPALLKRFRQSVLAAAVSGRLTEGWRRENEIDDSSWNEDILISLCDKSRGVSYGVIKLGEFENGGIPCLRTSDVKWLSIETNEVKKISKTISDNYKRTILQGNEILVNVRGTLGGVAVVPPDLIGWNISREVAMVPLLKNYNAKFIAFSIASLKSQNWLNEVAKGVAYTGINLQDLRNLPLSIPSSEEQHEIVRRVEQLFGFADKIEARYVKAKAMLDRLPQSILAKAFRGELVPQDPDDEPAGVLLERIRAEKNTAVKHKKKR